VDLGYRSCLKTALTTAKGPRLDTDTRKYPLISDEEFARVCQNFTQIRVFKLLKVSQCRELVV